MTVKYFTLTRDNSCNGLMQIKLYNTQFIEKVQKKKKKLSYFNDVQCIHMIDDCIILYQWHKDKHSYNQFSHHIFKQHYIEQSIKKYSLSKKEKRRNSVKKY